MGRDDDFLLYVPTARLAGFLRDLDTMTEHDERGAVELPGGEAVGVGGWYRFAGGLRVVVREGVATPPIGVSVRFPADPEVLAFAEGIDGAPTRRPDSVAVGYIYLSMMVLGGWTEVTLTAATTSMSDLFRSSGAVHRTLLDLHDRHGGGGAFYYRIEPEWLCLRLDDMSGEPSLGPREFGEHGAFDVEAWTRARGGWRAGRDLPNA